jgi:hypothetical protein
MEMTKFMVRVMGEGLGFVPVEEMLKTKIREIIKSQTTLVVRVS